MLPLAPKYHSFRLLFPRRRDPFSDFFILTDSARRHLHRGITLLRLFSLSLASLSILTFSFVLLFPSRDSPCLSRLLQSTLRSRPGRDSRFAPRPPAP